MRKVAFPIFGHYSCPVRYFVENALDLEFVRQPDMTRRTIEIGAKYSPDMVCTPYKITLGSLIEALEAGADTIITTMGLCRLGYYGELQEQTLRDLGYDFEVVNFAEYTTGSNRDYYKALKKMNPKLKAVTAGKVGLVSVKMAEYLDELEELYYQRCGFEQTKGAHKKAWDAMYKRMWAANSKEEVEAAYHRCKQAFAEIPMKEDELDLKVGVIGEYFTVMDAFSNLDLEQTLADMGVSVYRWLNLTHRNIRYPGEKNLNVQIRDLCQYEMGPTSTANIWCARNYAERGFDGLVHVKSAGCTPETDIMPVLQKISRQYDIPILYLTYDTQTGSAGLQTRLEAFYDMIRMRKKVLK